MINTLIKIITIINILIWNNFMFINDELIIAVGLISVYLFLMFTINKAIIYLFFSFYDNIYYYFVYLLVINVWMLYYEDIINSLYEFMVYLDYDVFVYYLIQNYYLPSIEYNVFSFLRKIKVYLKNIFILGFFISWEYIYNKKLYINNVRLNNIKNKNTIFLFFILKNKIKNLSRLIC